MSKLYYLKNNERGLVGNSILWWSENDNGYTCDLNYARKFTEKELEEEKLIRGDNKFTAYQTEDVDCLVQAHIDIQDLQANRKKPHTQSYRNKP